MSAVSLTEVAAYAPGVALALSALFIALTSPGPSVAAIMGASLGAGRRAGLSVAAGVAMGSFTWGTATALGLSVVLATLTWAMFALKIIGGAFLLWLAWKAFRAAASPADLEADILAASERRGSAYFVRGLLIHLTNPKAVIGWTATISLGLPAGAPVWVAGVIVGLGFFMSLTINGGYALLFSAPPMVRVYARARRWIQTGMGVLFAFAGLRMLTTRL